MWQNGMPLKIEVEVEVKTKAKKILNPNLSLNLNLFYIVSDHLPLEGSSINSE